MSRFTTSIRRLTSAIPSVAVQRSNPSTAGITTIPSRFSQTPQGPEDAILGITLAYNADPNPKKVNLGVGAYRCDAGLPFVLSAVREAEKRLLSRNPHMEYLPVAGSSSFVSKAVQLAYGDHPMVQPDNIAAIQTLSGTGACRMAGVLMSRFYNGARVDGKPVLLLPNPSWANHGPIFKDAGCHVDSYTYYDPKTKSLDFDGCLKSLSEAPSGAAVLLHACAHNPTGVDPTLEQWKEISAVMKENQLQPLFDMAYQGFTSGDMDTDAASLRFFAEDGHKVILAQSFSKNFGLYGQRVGCVSFLTDTPEEAKAVTSQLKIIARPMYSNPPIAGVRIVEEILSNPDLETSWKVEMKDMAQRIINMRTTLKENLTQLGNPHNWDHIIDQNGMFCFSGLTKDQVGKLRDDFSVYLTGNGRISMAGVTTENAAYLAEAIHAVSK